MLLHDKARCVESVGRQLQDEGGGLKPDLVATLYGEVTRKSLDPLISGAKHRQGTKLYTSQLKFPEDTHVSTVHQPQVHNRPSLSEAPNALL